MDRQTDRQIIERQLKDEDILFLSAGGNVFVNFTITSRSYSQEPTIELLRGVVERAVQTGEVGELQISEGSLSFQVLIAGETI